MNKLQFQFYSILYYAWLRRYTIVLPILILPLVGLTVGLFSAKHFKAHTSMLVQETAKMNPFLEDFAVSAMLKERVDGLKTLLHSRHILNEVAIELGLLSTSSKDATRDAVIHKLSSNLGMEIVGKDLIRIDYKSSSPEGMREFLESVSKHFIEQLLAPERSSIEGSEFFLSQHLMKKRRELEDAEQVLADFKAKHAEALPELHTINIARLSQLKQKLSERKAEYAGTIRNVDGIKHLLSRTNPVVSRLEEKIVSVRSELAFLGARYTDKHSRIQALHRSLRRLETERNNAIAHSDQKINTDKLWDIASLSASKTGEKTSPILVSQLESLQIAKRKTDSLSEEITRLQEMIQSLQEKVRSFGSKESELIGLQRDLNVKRSLYDDLLQRHEMARVTGSLGQFEQSKRIKIIDRPFTPSTPANLPLLVFVVAGFVGGIFLGIGMTILQSLADTTVRFPQNLDKIFDVPVVSRIPPMTQI